jgi:ABC-2 type transport system ATP-binding protein
MEPAIRLNQVSKSFGPVKAVDGIDLAVHPGELFALVGPDGAGKTTLARLTAGVLVPSWGKVKLMAPSGFEGRRGAGGGVGYLSGRFSMYPDLTVWENLMFFARVYGMRTVEAASEARRLLEWVGLFQFRDRLGGALSGGMRQKLALVCAMIHRPPVLILDEPTTAVDPVARAEFWNLLRDQATQGRAVLVTTPYLDEAEHCHQVALLHQGRILATGTVRELKERLPYRMALLSPIEGRQVRRAEAIAVSEALPGRRWTQPLGTAVRVALNPVALAPEAPLVAPPGYTLTEAPATLEDTYLWLSGFMEGVAAR